jgi:hypothetical protein
MRKNKNMITSTSHTNSKFDNLKNQHGKYNNNYKINHFQLNKF